jgi:hypothetical protein
VYDYFMGIAIFLDCNYKISMFFVFCVNKTKVTGDLVDVKSKCFRSCIFTRPTLFWTWMSGPSFMDLTCLLDSHYLILLGVSRENGHS